MRGPIIAAIVILGTSVTHHQSPNIGPGPSMTSPRSGHTATLLTGGKVLLAGGMRANRQFFASAELYDPYRNTFASTGRMATERVGHAAVLLTSGSVLVVGGWTHSGPTATAEIYDPASQRFLPVVAALSVARGRPSATRLEDGRILIVGGVDIDAPGSRLKSAEAFDPRTQRFSVVGSMTDARISHTAILLADGRVLVVGGRDSVKGVLSSAEIYDPRTNRFSRTGSLAHGRYKHTAALLPDGRVLVAGGSDDRDWNGTTSSAEIYDPRTGRWLPAPNMTEARFKLPEEAVRLSSGRILIAGGAQHAELYDERANRFFALDGEIDLPRHFMSETLLSNGDVLLAGGYPDSDAATAQTWLVRGIK